MFIISKIEIGFVDLLNDIWIFYMVEFESKY